MHLSLGKGMQILFYGLQVLHAWHTCQQSPLVAKKVSQDNLAVSTAAPLGFAVHYLSIKGFIKALMDSLDPCNIAVEVKPTAWIIHTYSILTAIIY